jgi:ribulose 1,5-bisphosphate synthetase/thiazole synthase
MTASSAFDVIVVGAGHNGPISARYLVGRDAILAATMAKFIPDRVMDRLL